MQEKFNILIADDDAEILSIAMQPFLADLPGATVHLATSIEECLYKINEMMFKFILLDISFFPGDRSGLDLVTVVKRNQPNSQVYMLSNVDDPQTMIKCISLGAFDFISKGELNFRHITLQFKNQIQSELIQKSDIVEGRELASEVGAVFTSKSMSQIFANIVELRKTPNCHVLVTGETGTGKDVIAKAIHSGSSNRPFIAVDCGAISENLAESELFGHVKGSFTGSSGSKLGRFQLADGGDLFLDEIGNLKPSIQEKLLRALQNREITPVGGKPIKVNTRVIAATNENLESLVEQGKFRRDLLVRLQGAWIQLPPLRDRPEDIPGLVANIISKSKRPDLTISSSCLKIFQGHTWPGNVRELENIVQFMVRCVKDGPGPLNIGHAPEYFRSSLTNTAVVDGEAPKSIDHFSHVSVTLPMNQGLDAAEHVFIHKYLTEHIKRMPPPVNKTKLAQKLGIARNTLDSYIKKTNIDLDRFIGTEVLQ
jgi:DNA-binding NtrC family response regulator